MPKASLSQTQSDKTSRQAAAELLLIRGHLTNAAPAGNPDLPFTVYEAVLIAQWVKNPLQGRRPWFSPQVGKIPWRRERLPTPVLWPGEFHGLYSEWGPKELDTTEGRSLSLWEKSYLA